MTLFQFTLPCGERHTRDGSLAFSQIISIHAPVRGATTDSCYYSVFIQISIHAPVRGATSVNWQRSLFKIISIHAPVRGATYDVWQHYYTLKDFNSRSRAGSDWHSFSKFFWFIISIHAPVRGATRKLEPVGVYLIFQFTLPCGERPQQELEELEKKKISIHAPVRGATYTKGFDDWN